MLKKWQFSCAPDFRSKGIYLDISHCRIMNVQKNVQKILRFPNKYCAALKKYSLDFSKNKLFYLNFENTILLMKYKIISKYIFSKTCAKYYTVLVLTADTSTLFEFLILLKNKLFYGVNRPCRLRICYWIFYCVLSCYSMTTVIVAHHQFFIYNSILNIIHCEILKKFDVQQLLQSHCNKEAYSKKISRFNLIKKLIM